MSRFDDLLTESTRRPAPPCKTCTILAALPPEERAAFERRMHTAQRTALARALSALALESGIEITSVGEHSVTKHIRQGHQVPA